MANPYFTFRQFTIWHDRCAMKVGTDGVLLGAWACVEDVSRILDIGTGSGLIAIMLAQRSTALVDAVEIYKNACLQAHENIAACPWKKRITLYHDAVQDFQNKTVWRYDLIVSNPPFFRNSLKPPARSRSVARHGDLLGYENLLVSASALLGPGGRLSVILPAREKEHFTQLAYFHGLYPARILMVRPSPDKGYSRCLVELGRDRNQPCTQEELSILLQDGKRYSDDYFKLTRDFYLDK